MKKWRMGIASAALATALIGTTAAMAAGGGYHHGWSSAAGAAGSDAATAVSCYCAGYCWQDTDGDGIGNVWSGACGDADGDGICDICGRTAYGYVDADGDGVCDHYGIGHMGGGRHHGGHRGCH